MTLFDATDRAQEERRALDATLRERVASLIEASRQEGFELGLRAGQQLTQPRPQGGLNSPQKVLVTTTAKCRLCLALCNLSHEHGSGFSKFTHIDKGCTWYEVNGDLKLAYAPALRRVPERRGPTAEEVVAAFHSR